MRDISGNTSAGVNHSRELKTQRISSAFIDKQKDILARQPSNDSLELVVPQ